MFPEILATPEAAKSLGVSASFLSKLRCTGGGPSYVKLGRRVLYPKAGLDAWVESCRRISTSGDALMSGKKQGAVTIPLTGKNCRQSVRSSG